MELHSPHRDHNAARTCYLTDNARQMFNLNVQSSYYPHFFELEANQPFLFKLNFYILQQWLFPICYSYL